MRYYKHSVANITDKDARARAEAMYNAVEWVVGGVRYVRRCHASVAYFTVSALWWEALL